MRIESPDRLVDRLVDKLVDRSMGRSSVSLFTVGLLAAGAVGCGGSGGEETSASGTDEMTPAAQEVAQVALGPLDGHDLAPTDLERVAVGTAAPDFSLLSLGGEVITLSDFQASKNVILVFYRGHW